MKDTIFTDNLDLIFYDISEELYRTYIYPDGIITIEKPLAVCWKEEYRPFGGSPHRVVDSQGTAHYLPAGWIGMEWQKDDNTPLFRF